MRRKILRDLETFVLDGSSFYDFLIALMVAQGSKINHFPMPTEGPELNRLTFSVVTVLGPAYSFALKNSESKLLCVYFHVYQTHTGHTCLLLLL